MGAKGTKEEEIPFFFLVLVEREKKRREREQQAFSLQSTEFCRSDFVRPRLKVHHLDEDYAWVPKRRGFTENQKEEFSEN